MDSMYRWPLTNLVYAAICGVVGGLLLAIGLANETDVLRGVGGFVLVIGAMYLLAGLWRLASVLREDSREP